MSQNTGDAVENADCDPGSASRSAVYFLKAEYRRALLWAIGGTALIVAVGLGLARWQQRPLLPIAGTFSILGLILLAWALPYFGPRFRVDENGIARRCLWWWDLWPWDAFAEGKICLGDSADGLEYLFPDKKLFGRRLNLGLLEPSDAESLNRLIREIWVPPPPPPLPESIQARSSWPNRFQIDLDKDRCTIHQRGETTSCRWDEIKKVEIWRKEHVRTDFTELFLELRGRDKPVHVRGEFLQGVSKAAFAGFLCRHISGDRIKAIALNGEARSRDDVTARLRRLDASATELARIHRGCALVMTATSAGIVAVLGLKGVLMVLLSSLLFYAVLWMGRDQQIALLKQRARLEEQGRAFDDCANDETAKR